MGKAARWLKGILGLKNSNSTNSSSSSSYNENNNNNTSKKDKKRWSFAKSRDSSVLSQIPINIANNTNTFNESAWLKTEQNKHAIAVAAATAAAADAAVAAAQAAVAVVRLTSNGRGRGAVFAKGREWWASVKIQTFFRGYLARKALRALKGLVKLQALVRGFLVRKRTAATLYSMQALIRAQTSVRSQRIRRSMNKESEIRGRKSIERFDDSRSEFHSKRLSTSYEMNLSDESPKIVEIDTYKPKSRSRRINSAVLSEFGDDNPYHAMSSPFPCPVPARIGIPTHHPDFEWCFNGDECRFSTAQSTPRFVNSARSNIPVTPSKSVCGDAYFRPYSNHPNYMANTQSFKAKLRSHSAPKQRPEPLPKKRMSLNEIMASRNSISTIRMQRQYPVHEDEEEGFDY
ncbi:hypothetical protein ACFE04_003995 [Oxalis oulophora]